MITEKIMPVDAGSITREPSKDYTNSKSKTSKFKKIFNGIRKNGAMGVITSPEEVTEPSISTVEAKPTREGGSMLKMINGIRKDGAVGLTLSVTSENSASQSQQQQEPTMEEPSSKENIVRMDKYGFILSGDSPTAGKHHTPLLDPDVRLNKWQDMLDRVPSGKKTVRFSNTQSKVKYYTRRGLPDSMRRRAWTVLTGVDAVMAQREGEYEGLVRRADEEFERWRCHVDNGEENDKMQRRDSEVSALGDASVSNAVLETIDRDIHRTFPKHYLFHNGLDEEDDGGDGSVLTGSVDDSEDVGDSDDEDDEDADEHELVPNEMTDENKMEKKKMFDDMIGRSLSLTGCGRLDDVSQSEKKMGDKSSSVASTAEASSASSTEGHGAGQAALRRILRAYSVYDSEVGYCQGMNFIAAMFLTFLSEEESFWLLVIVMNEEPYKLRELFGEDMSGTHEVLYIAEKLLQQFLPKLSQHMEAESIHISMFVTQWLLTVYTSTFPFELVSRVWDSFLVEGWKVVYRVMLALMEQASKDVINFSFEQILNYFREFPNSVDGAKVMDASLKIPLKRKHIQKHVTEWRRGNTEDNSKTSSGLVNPFRRRESQESSASGTVKSHGEGSKGSKTSSSRSRFKKRRSGDITIEDLGPKLSPIVGSSKFAIMINNVLTPEECAEVIDLAEQSGFQPAAIYDAATKTVHRNCTSRMIEDEALAENWFERILHALNDTPYEHEVKACPWNKNNESLQAVSLNERLNVNRYAQGQFYTKHMDAAFIRGSDAGDKEGEKSLMSVHIYLNDGYKGGITRFHGGKRWFDVNTKMGSVLLFESSIPHEAVKVTKGEKYVVRSDIMYSSKTDLSEVAGTGFTQQL